MSNGNIPLIGEDAERRDRGLRSVKALLGESSAVSGLLTCLIAGCQLQGIFSAAIQRELRDWELQDADYVLRLLFDIAGNRATGAIDTGELARTLLDIVYPVVISMREEEDAETTVSGADDGGSAGGGAPAGAGSGDSLDAAGEQGEGDREEDSREG